MNFDSIDIAYKNNNVELMYLSHASKLNNNNSINPSKYILGHHLLILFASKSVEKLFSEHYKMNEYPMYHHMKYVKTIC